MKTIKIIDLLNKKNNDEELPKKFKYDNEVFIYDNEENDYIYENGNVSFFNDYCSPIYNFADCLATFNKEVEIIEEEKEIEKLDRVNGSDLVDLQSNNSLIEQNKAVTNLIMYLNINVVKINELIEAVNEIRKEK